MSESLKIVKIGIMPLELFKKYTLAIAKGEYEPKDETKIWFTSMKSLANILSEENQQLLRIISDVHPQSIKELESVTGRKANNILRTLRTMERYGLIKLIKGQQGKGRAPLVPKVVYDGIDVKINLKAD